MSGVDPHFTATVDRVVHAPQVAQLWMSVKEFTARLGYTHLSCADAGRLAGGASDALFYTDAPDFPQQLDRAYPFAYGSVPYVTRALASPEPFLISELRNDPQHEGPWQELMADVVKRGDGLLVPVYNGPELMAGFLFGGEKPDTSLLARAMLQVLAHAAFARYRTLKADPTAALPILSAREIQCLRALAIGKTDIDAAKELGISPRTVRFHIDGAKAKLGVSTRAQAVAKALHEKIVTCFAYGFGPFTASQGEAALLHLACL